MDKIDDLKGMLRAAEMAPPVKCLLYKHLCLRLNFQNPNKARFGIMHLRWRQGMPQSLYVSSEFAVVHHREEMLTMAGI